MLSGFEDFFHQKKSCSTTNFVGQSVRFVENVFWGVTLDLFSCYAQNFSGLRGGVTHCRQKLQKIILITKILSRSTTTRRPRLRFDTTRNFDNPSSSAQLRLENGRGGGGGASPELLQIRDALLNKGSLRFENSVSILNYLFC